MIGLRNPTLYELFGTDNFGFSGNKDLKAEESLTDEVYAKYLLNENFLYHQHSLGLIYQTT